MLNRNRFNRQLTAEQVTATIGLLREAARAREKTDRVGADLLWKSTHIVATLWREVALHDHLADSAAATLSKVELKLAECLQREALKEAAVLDEVRQLRETILNPSDNLQNWAPPVN